MVKHYTRVKVWLALGLQMSSPLLFESCMKEDNFFYQGQQIDKCEQYLQGVLPLKIHT